MTDTGVHSLPRLRALSRVRHASLFLAVSIHVAAGYLITSSSHRSQGQAPGPGTVKILRVSLPPSSQVLPGARAALPATAEIARASGAADTGTVGTADRMQNAQAETSVISIAQPAGPHYFRMRDLTERPALLHDPVAALVIHIPGLPPQPVILRLLISDEGKVDRVVVEDSFLARDIERQVTEAFAKVRFQPGKIGRIAVRSQMRVEARLESVERRLPETGSPG